jgi:hypothetical protein
MSILCFQVDSSDVICNEGADTKAETKISGVTNFHSVMAASLIDVSFLSPQRDFRVVLGINEVKNVERRVSTAETRNHILQLGAYMVLSLAFDMWGVRLKPVSEPITGLLVYDTGIYRLSITKPVDGDVTPFGVHQELEYTQDPNMMAWVVEKYVRDYVSNYRLNGVGNLKPGKSLDPKSWTRVNYDFEKGLPRYETSSASNMGFLFRSNAANLNFLMGVPGFPIQSSIINKKLPNEDFVVKYVSALLVSPPEQYYQSVLFIIESEISKAENFAEMQLLQARIKENLSDLKQIELRMPI